MTELKLMKTTECWKYVSIIFFVKHTKKVAEKKIIKSLNWWEEKLFGFYFDIWKSRKFIVFWKLPRN